MNEEKIFQMLGTLDERTKLIFEQTKKTNGRIIWLEKRVDILESERDNAAGAKQVKKGMGENFWRFATIIVSIGSLAIATIK